jgi:hypothetical protein
MRTDGAHWSPLLRPTTLDHPSTHRILTRITASTQRSGGTQYLAWYCQRQPSMQEWRRTLMAAEDSASQFAAARSYSAIGLRTKKIGRV